MLGLADIAEVISGRSDETFLLSNVLPAGIVHHSFSDILGQSSSESLDLPLVGLEKLLQDISGFEFLCSQIGQFIYIGVDIELILPIFIMFFIHTKRWQFDLMVDNRILLHFEVYGHAG